MRREKVRECTEGEEGPGGRVCKMWEEGKGPGEAWSRVSEGRPLSERGR
jgi:hypothetical protein